MVRRKRASRTRVRTWTPKRVPPGMQNLRMRLVHKLVTCEELHGDPCGIIHTQADDRYLPLYVYNDDKGEERIITEDELKQRTGEGTYTIQFIKERGL